MDDNQDSQFEEQFDDQESRFERIKRHIKENKTTYLVGGVCLGAGYFLRKPQVVGPVFNNTPVISPVMNNIVHNTVNNGGCCTKIVQRLSDKEIFEKAGDAAFEIAEKYDISYERARWMLSRHLNGHLEDVFGEVYRTIALGTNG